MRRSAADRSFSSPDSRLPCSHGTSRVLIALIRCAIVRFIAVPGILALLLLPAWAPPAFAQTPAAPLDSPAKADSDELSLEPYSVYVAHEKMYARCGPSQDYYRTDPLRMGQHLDVYAETDDGWLGIRPPEGSFCWIPADTVQLDPGQESGTITEDRTVAWIGTHLGRARSYRWQVQMAKGEPVTIIGRSEREGPDGPQLWFRIVPPSGEYRWVHREQIVFTSEELVAQIQSASASVSTPTNSAQASVAPRRSSGDRSNESAASPQVTPRQPSNDQPSNESDAVSASGRSILTPMQPIGSGLKPELKSAPVANASPTGNTVASMEFLGQPQLLEINQTPVAPQDSMSAGDDNWVAGPRRNPTSDVASKDWTTTRTSSLGTVMQVSGDLPAPKQTIVSAERIAQIESEVQNVDFDQLSLVFSRLIASQATAAEIEPVERAANQLAASTGDTVMAGRARLLSERARQYRRVATRRDGDSVIRSETPPTIATANYNTPMQTIPGSPNSTSQSPTQATSQSGYLVQVYSARRDSPPFALTDDAGRTIAYVSPMPGVNLRTHLNSKVTVTGRPGFVTGLNTPHIRAAEAFRTRR